MQPRATHDLTHSAQRILRSGLFDDAFYRRHYHGRADPLIHYLREGEAQGRCPNLLFFPRYYRRHAMPGVPAAQNALAHYAQLGERLGHKPCPAFDPRKYLAANRPLDEFVDRPLFHFLRIGLPANLSVAPGSEGQALSRVIEFLPLLAGFEASGRRDIEALCVFRRMLVRELGVERAFDFYKEVLGLPDDERLEQKPIESFSARAFRRAATVHQSGPLDGPPGGWPFGIAEGRSRKQSETYRKKFVTCFVNARVRAGSAAIEVEDAILLDCAGSFDASGLVRELESDLAIFHVDGERAWVIASRPTPEDAELDEAFALLAPRGADFAHWICEVLPRYIAASGSGALPRVPVLVDANMPAAHRQCLEAVLPAGQKIIALPGLAAVRVRRLWCAPNPLRADFAAQPAQVQAAAPACFGELVRDMVRRVAAAAPARAGPGKLFLSLSGDREPGLQDLEELARARGFAVIDPERLDFFDRIGLVRGARFIIACSPKHLPLALFAQPGAGLCDLSLAAGKWKFVPALLEDFGIAVAAVDCGVHAKPDNGQNPIAAGTFADFLDRWLASDKKTMSRYLEMSAAAIGFKSSDETEALAEICLSLPPDAVVVEIGSFMGSGLIALAGARRVRGSGRVHGVDPFDCSGEPFALPIYDEIMAQMDGRSLRAICEENIRRAGLAEWVELHQGTAVEIAAHWNTPVDLIFLDGDQSRAGVRAAYDAWIPFLKPGGIIAIHNSAPNSRPEQDGPRVLVRQEIRPPVYSDIRLVYSTTVARRLSQNGRRPFSYWDKPDLSPVQPTLEQWRTHFADFMILGDAEVEPILRELFPHHVELFRSIRIPTCKSDVALLLLLYEFGGLYVDCHCGIRDADAIRRLLRGLDCWELILYDKNRQEAPRPATEIYPLNSVLFARPHSPIVLEAARLALRNLSAQRSAERERGFQPYHIATLSGPAILSDVLFADATSPVSQLKEEYDGRVYFIPEDAGAPIARYMHYQYRIAGMHWSERQQRELLFE